jgi:hypothetical protein
MNNSVGLWGYFFYCQTLQNCYSSIESSPILVTTQFFLKAAILMNWKFKMVCMKNWKVFLFEHLISPQCLHLCIWKVPYILECSPHSDSGKILHGQQLVHCSNPPFCPQGNWLNNIGCCQCIKIEHYIWGWWVILVLKWAILNNHAQFHLKPARALVFKM